MAGRACKAPEVGVTFTLGVMVLSALALALVARGGAKVSVPLAVRSARDFDRARRDAAIARGRTP